jgi:5-hydroxyisourate hydrolase-like protein (transthyretin family)
MSAMIPANSVHLIGGGNVIKQGDETPLTFQLNDESGQPVDLAGATVTVRMANSQIVVLTKQVTVNDDNTVSFAITSDEATGHGEMRLEFVVNKEGKQEIFPAQGFQQITIQPSLGSLDSGYVAVITLEEFERRVNEAVNRAYTATDGAIEAMNAANTAAQFANEKAQAASTAAELANGAADKANQAAQNATAEASNLSQLKTDVSAATDEANSAATSATQAATNANTAAQNATTQANYAKAQGDYAKQQGDVVKGIIESGTVASVNGQKGAVVLGANDIGAIPATEKGVAGGVAKLNEDGKVVDASGNEVEGKVKSVNGQTGEVNIIIPTKTSELVNDSDFATQQFVAEKVGEVQDGGKVLADDFAKLRINFIDLAIETETLKAAELTGVNANIFIETFQDLDDVILERGGYDSANKRLVV